MLQIIKCQDTLLSHMVFFLIWFQTHCQHWHELFLMEIHSLRSGNLLLPVNVNPLNISFENGAAYPYASAVQEANQL